MIIKTLKLQNYRRFEYIDIEFPENLIGIIGRNGAGKSTIVEAIGWALYGNKFVRTDKHDVRSQHIEQKSVCSVELEFVYGGSEFRIERKLKGKKASVEAAVWRDGDETAVAVQDSGVNDFIEDLLQLDYRSFTTSVFAQQKELAKLTTLQPEQRRQAINRLINIDRIDRAREGVRRDRKEKWAYVQGIKSTLKDVEKLKAQQKDLKADYNKMKRKKRKLTAELEEQSTLLKTAREKFEMISKVRDQYRNWDAQISTLKSRQLENQKNVQRSHDELSEIDKAASELKELAPQLSEFETVKSDYERMDAEREKLTHLNSRLKEKQLLQDSLDREKKNLERAKTKAENAERLQTALDTTTTEINKCENALEEKRRDVNEIRVQKRSAEEKGKDLKEKLDRINDLGPEGECPVCTQRLGDFYDGVVCDHEKQLAELRNQFTNLRKQEEHAATEQKELQKQLAKMRVDRDDIIVNFKSAQDAAELTENIKEHLINYESQISLIDKAIEKIGRVEYDEDQHTAIKTKYQTLLGLQQKAAKLEERIGRRESVMFFIETTKKELETIQQDIQSALTAQAALEFDEKEFERNKRNVDEKNAEFSNIKDQRAHASQDLAVLARDIENVKNEMAAQKKLTKDIKKAEDELVYLDALDQYLGQFRLELAGRIRPFIAQRASELLGITTTLRYTQLDLDPDYNIKIYDGNRAFPIERFSGGEQDLANLCLRIAISQVVAERSGGAPINFIVLDEIFGSQDSERRDLILNALGKISSQFRQIFIITHIEAVRDLLPVLVNVEARDEVTSQVDVI